MLHVRIAFQVYFSITLHVNHMFLRCAAYIFLTLPGLYGFSFPALCLVFFSNIYYIHCYNITYFLYSSCTIHCTLFFEYYVLHLFFAFFFFFGYTTYCTYLVFHLLYLHFVHLCQHTMSAPSLHLISLYHLQY